MIKRGENMKTKYGNKEIIFKFFYKKDGNDFFKIVERVYKEYVSNEKILVGGKR